MKAPLLVLLVACASTQEDPQPEPDASPRKPVVPSPTGPCPAIENGDVTFSPAGMQPRKVKLAVGAQKPGPLILYWHATGSGPIEASYALGATHDQIVADGGIIATPYSDPAAGNFEWFIVNGSDALDDFKLADEIVGCLAERIDTARIHSMGMSAGALQTTALSFMRASYVASVATYSGGLPNGFTPTVDDPSQKIAALIFHGGPTDRVFGVDFKAASETYRSMLATNGHYAAICAHTNGHEIPLDAAASVYAMFRAHPFATSPSPYANGLPAEFPAYCR